MPQVTGAVSSASFALEVSTNGTSWTDMSPAANKYQRSGGERFTGETFTVEGDNAIVTTGKKQPEELTFDLVYTETTTHPYYILRGFWDNNTPVFIRVSPNGGTVGNLVYSSTTAGRLTKAPTTSGDAGSGNPVMVSFTWRGPALTQGVRA